MSEGRTSVVITHRMAAAMMADEIVVLDQGVIVESGTHDSLLALNGLYAERCQLQKIGTTHHNGTTTRSPKIKRRVSDG